MPWVAGSLTSRRASGSALAQESRSIAGGPSARRIWSNGQLSMTASCSAISRPFAKRSVTPRLRLERPSRKIPLCSVSAVMTSSEPRDVEAVGKAFAQCADQLSLRGDVVGRGEVFNRHRLGDPLPEIAHQIDADGDSDRQRGDDVAEATHQQNRKLLRAQEDLLFR